MISSREFESGDRFLEGHGVPDGSASVRCESIPSDAAMDLDEYPRHRMSPNVHKVNNHIRNLIARVGGVSHYLYTLFGLWADAFPLYFGR